MTDVTVLLPSGLLPFSAGQREFTVPAGTVADVVAGVETACPSLVGHVIEAGRLRTHLLLAVDDEITRDLDTPVPSGGTLRILAAVSGG